MAPVVLPFLALQEFGFHRISFLAEVNLGFGIGAQVIYPRREIRYTTVGTNHDHVVAIPQMTQHYRARLPAAAANGGYQQDRGTSNTDVDQAPAQGFVYPDMDRRDPR